MNNKQTGKGALTRAIKKYNDDKLNKNNLLVYEVKNNFRTYGLISLNNLFQHIYNKEHIKTEYHEIFIHDKFKRLTVDIDLKKETFKIYKIGIMEFVENIILNVINEIKLYVPEIDYNDINYIIATNNRTEKYSYHVTFINILIKQSQEKYFFTHIENIKSLITNDIIDTHIYRKNASLRIVGCYKGKNKQPLQIINVEKPNFKQWRDTLALPDYEVKNYKIIIDEVKKNINYSSKWDNDLPDIVIKTIKNDLHDFEDITKSPVKNNWYIKRGNKRKRTCPFGKEHLSNNARIVLQNGVYIYKCFSTKCKDKFFTLYDSRNTNTNTQCKKCKKNTLLKKEWDDINGWVFSHDKCTFYEDDYT